MERVRYTLPETDDDSTCEGKYEAILDVVKQNGNKSDVGIDATHHVPIYYAEGERSRLEPTVLAIVNNSDHTFWDVAERAVYGVSQNDIRSRLERLNLSVGSSHLATAQNETTVTVTLKATMRQWKTILARLEMGEGSIGPVMDAEVDDD